MADPKTVAQEPAQKMFFVFSNWNLEAWHDEEKQLALDGHRTLPGESIFPE
jgi:hypothetical protein